MTRLTARQRDVLGLVCEGLTNAEIGSYLYCSTKTVSTELRRIYRTLGCTNRVQAAAYAARAEA